MPLTIQSKRGMQFDYEVKHRSKSLRELRKHVLQYGEAERSVIAQIVIGHGFRAHVGGRHVAVLGLHSDERQAIITSKTQPDFN